MKTKFKPELGDGTDTFQVSLRMSFSLGKTIHCGIPGFRVSLGPDDFSFDSDAHEFISLPQLIQTVSAVDQDDPHNGQHFHYSLAPEAANNPNFTVRDNQGNQVDRTTDAFLLHLSWILLVTVPCKLYQRLFSSSKDINANL